MIKETGQRFVFKDMSYQDFPHSIDERAVFVIVDKSINLSDMKFGDGELVPKTSEDLLVEDQAKFDVLRSEYETLRQLALMSFELTVFSDTTLSLEQQNDIRRVRQEWRDMTEQSGYPVDFIEPKLNADLWS